MVASVLGSCVASVFWYGSIVWAPPVRAGNSKRNFSVSKMSSSQSLPCGYKDDEVDKIINKTVTKKYQRTERKEENDDNQYGIGYRAFQKGLNTIVKNNDAKNKFNLRLTFKTNKKSSYFSNKLNIVFSFKCQGCDAQ